MVQFPAHLFKLILFHAARPQGVTEVQEASKVLQFPLFVLYLPISKIDGRKNGTD